VLCRPVSPGCAECPVADACAWRGSAADDPAIGSAGVSGRQARFEGSDRQARGRLLKALAAGPVPMADAPTVVGRPPDAAARIVASVIADGLCLLDPTANTLHLP